MGHDFSFGVIAKSNLYQPCRGLMRALAHAGVEM
jgi:hypothetical protein